MIDNMLTHITSIHTAAKTTLTEDKIVVYPTQTTGIVHIEAQKRNMYHIIEEIVLINPSGQILQRYGKSPTKFWIDISDKANGLYYLKVRTNFKTETLPVILNK